MNESQPDKLGLKGRMQIFAALQHTYGRDTAFDIATKSYDAMLKIVAVASVDQHAAQILMHDLATLREKKEGSEADNARRWQRRLNRALDKARYDTPKSDTSIRVKEKELA